VSEQAETRYARSGDVSIAYQVVGDSPFDLVWTPGAFTNLELGWTEPAQARFRNALAAFARLILFDKRGTGLSDRVAADRRAAELKGVPGEWRLYAVAS